MKINLFRVTDERLPGEVRYGAKTEDGKVLNYWAEEEIAPLFKKGLKEGWNDVRVSTRYLAMSADSGKAPGETRVIIESGEGWRTYLCLPIEDPTK